MCAENGPLSGRLISSHSLNLTDPNLHSVPHCTESNVFRKQTHDRSVLHTFTHLCTTNCLNSFFLLNS